MIALVFGTRPEIIKLSPVIRLLERKRRPFFMIHTGQHYSYRMDRLFFKELKLPIPQHRVFSASKSFPFQGQQTGRIMAGLEKILAKRKTSIILVQGDTNSVLAASLVAAKLPGVRLGHVEAGLRSYDRRMPEEINRVLSDHVSDFLFAPTPGSKKILLQEGIGPEKIFVTGNTIVDAVKENLEIARKKMSAQALARRRGKRFFLMTLHRPENVDAKERLSSVFEGLRRVTQEFKTPVIFPIHPRTAEKIKHFRIRVPSGIHCVAPTGFLEFLFLESRAELILTDSGGIQEEACILKTPCVTLRTTTERPETLRAGANVLAGYEPEAILESSKKMFRKKRDWANPFGDGHAARRILRVLDKS